MTSPLAGWYPDPADPARQRYWAGDAWTVETRPFEGAGFAPSPPDPFTRKPVVAARPAGQTPVYRGPAVAAPIDLGKGPRTADGVPLAGWWWRVLAWLIDWLILGVVSIVYSGFLPDYSTGLTAWQNDYLHALQSGSLSLPLPVDPQYAISWPLAIGEMASVGFTCVYVIVMLHFSGATLGQLVLGIRVVPVDKGLAPRRLAMPHILGRVLSWNILPAGLVIAGVLLIGSVPANRSIGMLCLMVSSIYIVVTALWAAWDPKRQGLHDKLARTQLIRPLR